MPCYPSHQRLCVSIMCLFAHMVLCGSQNDGANLEIEGKIIGGSPVPIEMFPHTVQFFNSGALCAGSILSGWVIMTAAHCFDYNQDITEMEIHVGSRYSYDMRADVYNIWYFIKHEDYNKAMPFACDIALIFVTKSITFTKRTRKAVLVNTNEWMVPGEINFTATGWGWTKYNGPISQHGLMMTTLHFISLNKCMQLHKLNMTEDMFCLYGDAKQDTCKGDSGGGVEWNEMIVGIVSHGDGCAQKNKPSVYSNVWYFRSWLEKQIKKFMDQFCDRASKDGIVNGTDETRRTCTVWNYET